MMGRNLFKGEGFSTRAKLISFSLLILLFGIFLGRNYTPTPVWIFGWTPSVPLIGIALLCFLLGCGCGWSFTMFFHKKSLDE